MNNKNKIQKVQLILTTLVWILIFAIPILFGDSENGINWDNILKIWKEYSILFIIFLINRYILMPYLFFKRKNILYFLFIIATIVLSSTILSVISPEKTKNKPFGIDPISNEYEFGHPPPMDKPKPFIPPYGNFFIMSILLIGFDSGLLFFSKWMESEQNKLQAEKDSIKNKMAFLQNQISPHFFMNTLNNIHALIDIDKEEAQNAVIKLSHMMDYMLYESQTDNISLKQEIDFISSYIDLMKLRYTDATDIKFVYPEILPPIKIPPLLTISLIENAFKYGISYESPSFIHINITVDESSISTKITNTIHKGQIKKKNSGIGIKNTRNRLDIIYGNNYDLTISDDNTFCVNLNIPI